MAQCPLDKGSLGQYYSPLKRFLLHVCMTRTCSLSPRQHEQTSKLSCGHGPFFVKTSLYKVHVTSPPPPPDKSYQTNLGYLKLRLIELVSMIHVVEVEVQHNASYYKKKGSTNTLVIRGMMRCMVYVFMPLK